MAIEIFFSCALYHSVGGRRLAFVTKTKDIADHWLRNDNRLRVCPSGGPLSLFALTQDLVEGCGVRVSWKMPKGCHPDQPDWDLGLTANGNCQSLAPWSSLPPSCLVKNRRKSLSSLTPFPLLLK